LLNLSFLLRENLLLCSSYLPLGVPNWVVICPHHGIITLRKKPLGSMKKLFEKFTLTYLLAILKLEGKLHLKGVSL
jgi:hypothetical protein